MVKTEARSSSEGAKVIAGSRWSRALPWGMVSRLGRISALKTLPLSWALAQDPRRLCKYLDLHGWELWQQLDDTPSARPLRVQVAANDHWPLAIWSVVYYRGPVLLVWSATGGTEERFLIDLDLDSRRQTALAGEPIEAHLRTEPIQGPHADLTLAATRRGRRLEIQLQRAGARGGSGPEHHQPSI